MTQFLDMNEDCIGHVLQWFKQSDSDSIDTIVAVSLTCTRLQSLTSRFMRHNSYSCSITSDEDEKRAKRTIATIGKRLVELNVNIAESYTALGPTFLKRLPSKCPNLKKFNISSNVSLNATLDGARMLHHLEDLSVHCYNGCTEDVDRRIVIRLAQDSKRLKSLKVTGAEWDYKTVVDFIHTAEKLDCLIFEIEYVQKHLCYEISNCLMDEFRYLDITESAELIYFLEFRDLLKHNMHNAVLY
ncbi:uncharacterized protein LOC119080085 [Bradysia coprophila]|uniref:uncharacterized protein LOC119080085 n=1 Tax=Bradysia coprophila TaxID=38358 RepID=UPI00187DA572|nr:uncharacterized protein LOC119080085 [Bradysia coprophila]